MNEQRISVKSVLNPFLGIFSKDQKNVLHLILFSLHIKCVSQIFLLLRSIVRSNQRSRNTGDNFELVASLCPAQNAKWLKDLN